MARTGLGKRETAEKRPDRPDSFSPPPPPPPPPLCEFRSVTKWYGPVIGVNHISFQLPAGITGVVGHNGAGKSTLIKLLVGQLRPSLGEVRVRGCDAWSSAAKYHVGYCPDIDTFYEEMSGRRFVYVLARLHGFGVAESRARAEQVLDRVGMSQRCDRPLGSYSKGMRQRIKLAQALVHDPALIVLDEPLNGVDPVGRSDLIRLFHALAEQGKTVLISSHILDEVDALAQWVFFMCRGRMLASGTLRAIRAMLADHPLKIHITSDRIRELAGDLVEFEEVLGLEIIDEANLIAEVRQPRQFHADFADLVISAGYDVERMHATDISSEALLDYLMKRARFL